MQSAWQDARRYRLKTRCLRKTVEIMEHQLMGWEATAGYVRP